MEDRNHKSLTHEIILVDRENLQLTGVKDVDSFDSEEFLLDTEYGYLSITGKNLHIKVLNLDQGTVIIEGIVDNVRYINDGSSEKTKGFFGKLFK
ncbi:MAG: sporulation protein YabP [Vulcanibacillus sp.]